MTHVPAQLKYSKTHEWVDTQESQGHMIGITDHAQSQLGDIVFVELPHVGKILKQGDVFGVIESVKAASDLYAPISGEVVAVNQALMNQPELVNESTYDDGWIIKIKPSHPAEINALLDAQGYQTAVLETVKE